MIASLHWVEKKTMINQNFEINNPLADFPFKNMKQLQSKN